MPHRDGSLGFIGECLELGLPQAVSDPIGTAPIRRQFLCVRIEGGAPLVPPAADTFHGQLRRVRINPDINEPLIVDQIIDAIGDGLAISARETIRDTDFGGFSCGLPLGPVILELAAQLLFLAVDRKDRVPVLLKGLAGGLDVGKLRRMGDPFTHFLIGAYRIPLRV